MLCRVVVVVVEGQHTWRGGTGEAPQVNFSVAMISCDVHSLVKRDVQLDVKCNDSPSHVMQTDALSCWLTESSSSVSLLFSLYSFQTLALILLIGICCWFVPMDSRITGINKQR